MNSLNPVLEHKAQVMQNLEKGFTSGYNLTAVPVTEALTPESATSIADIASLTKGGEWEFFSRTQLDAFSQDLRKGFDDNTISRADFENALRDINKLNKTSVKNLQGEEVNVWFRKSIQTDLEKGGVGSGRHKGAGSNAGNAQGMSKIQRNKEIMEAMDFLKIPRDQYEELKQKHGGQEGLHAHLGKQLSGKSQELNKSANEAGEGEDTLEKGAGEGSRGGKVIGHTKSGKPIYDNLKGDEVHKSGIKHEDLHDHVPGYLGLKEHKQYRDAKENYDRYANDGPLNQQTKIGYDAAQRDLTAASKKYKETLYAHAVANSKKKKK